MSSSSSPVSLHLAFFLGILFSFLGFNIVERFFDQIRLALIISPLILLAAVHLFSYRDRPFFSVMPWPESVSFQNDGGTPWGVGLLLVILLFLISYKADFRERWFPLLA